MAPQRTELAVATKGGEQVKRDLDQIGAAGERAFNRVKAAAKDVPAHLRAVDAAAADVRKRATDTAGALGPLGSALKALGPYATLGGAALVSIAGGFTLLAKRAIDSASALRDQADRVGVTVERLQELQVAGGQVGVSNELLGKSLEKLTANLGAARDGTGTLAKFLKATDSAFLGTIQRATDTGKAFDLLVGFIPKLPTEADKAAAAVAAFGKAGVQLLPLLEQGPKGLAAMASEARRLGIILDTELVNHADDAGDKLDLLVKVVSGNLNRALLSAAPQIAEVAKWLADAAAAGARFAASIGIGTLSPGMRLDAIKRELRDITEAQRNAAQGGGWADAITGGSGKGGTLATAQQRIEALKAEAREIRAQQEAEAKAEQQRLADRQKGLELLAKQRDEEASAEDARKKAASAADAAEKKRQSERKQALEEISRTEAQAARAGLEGIALVEKERDQAYDHFRELAEKGLLTEEETARAYLAVWQEAEGKRGRILQDAADKQAEKDRRAAEKAADELNKPFENALENVQHAFGDLFVDIFEQGSDAFTNLASTAEKLFIRLAAEIAEAFFAQSVVQPLIAQLKGVAATGVQTVQTATPGTPAGSGTLGTINTIGGGVQTLGSLAKLVGFGGQTSGGLGIGTLVQGIGGVLGLVNAFAGRGSPFGRVTSGLLGANALANTAGLGISIVPTTGGGLALQAAGNTLLTVSANGLSLGAGVAPGAVGSLVSPTQAAFLGIGAQGAAGTAATASTALSAVSAIAPYIAAAVATYIGVTSQISASKVLGKPNPQIDPGTLGYISPVQSVPYLLGKGTKGSSALAVQEILDPFTASLLSQTFGRIPVFGNLINPEPSYQDIKPELFRSISRSLNERLAGGAAVFGPTATLGRRGRAAARGFGGTDVGFLLDLTSEALSRGLTNAPGSPQARQNPGDVLATLRDLLKGGAARTAASGGDPVALLGKLVRELFDMGTAVKAANDVFLKRNSTELQAGKTAQQFTEGLAALIDIFGNRLPKGIDATRVAAKVLEDQGYATKRAIQRAALVESRDRAEREGTLILDPAVDDTAGGRSRIRGLRRRARAGILDAQDRALAAVDAAGQQEALLRGGPSVGVRQAFGAIQVALDKINLARKAKDFEQLGAAVDQADQAVVAWGQSILGLFDQVRALDRQIEDFTLTSREEIDALRKATTTGALYNDVLAANEARFTKLAASGGSAAAQLEVANRQLDLLRRQAAAQRQDVQEQFAAEETARQKRLTALSPLAGVAAGVRDQIDALLVGARPTAASQLTEVQRQLAVAQQEFRSGSGEQQAAAARRVQDLVAQSLALGGAAFGGGSQAFLGLRRAGLGALGEVQSAADAAEREVVDLLQRSAAAQEAMQQSLDAIDEALAAQLETWDAKILPLLQAQRDELFGALVQALPGQDIATLLTDPAAAQLAVLGVQTTLLTGIRDGINGLVTTLQGRGAGGAGNVIVNVTIDGAAAGAANAQLYARTAGDAIGARIALELNRTPATKRKVA